MSKVSVLGSSGHLGHAAMVAFRDAGWQVRGLARSDRRKLAGTDFIAGDAGDIATLRRVIADADVVVQGLHLPYDKWGDGRAEAQLQLVIEAVRGSGKTLLFPGTIYNYRASDRVVTPQLRQSAEAPRGEIRIRLETMLREAAAAGQFQVIILRAGDFYGPEERGEWFEQAMLMSYAKGRVYHLDALSRRHSWAYLPDLGAAFVALAEKRKQLEAFETFHFAGHFLSHGVMMAAIKQAAPRPLKPAPMPWWLLRVAGLFDPVMRDIHRMRYLWQNEMELVDPRLDALLGPGFGTPPETAIAATTRAICADKEKRSAVS